MKVITSSVLYVFCILLYLELKDVQFAVAAAGTDVALLGGGGGGEGQAGHGDGNHLLHYRICALSPLGRTDPYYVLEAVLVTIQWRLLNSASFNLDLFLAGLKVVPDRFICPSSLW